MPRKNNAVPLIALEISGNVGIRYQGDEKTLKLIRERLLKRQKDRELKDSPLSKERSR